MGHAAPIYKGGATTQERLGDPSQAKRAPIIDAAKMLGICKQRIQSRGDSQLWGPWLRAGAVSLLVGETSAGKTVFLYNLAKHLAAGEEFLGVTPARPLRLLYLDYESFADVRAALLEAIGCPSSWGFYDTESEHANRSAQLVSELTDRVLQETYDVVIVDPLLEAYLIEDESDSIQATAQMLAFRRLARTTNAAVLLVHNTGKGNPADKGAKFLGRGSSARPDRADLVINLTAPAQRERRLEIVKSRLGNLNDWIVYRFGDDYACEFASGSIPRQYVVATLKDECVKLARRLISSGATELTTADFNRALNPDGTEGKHTAIKRALAECVEQGGLTRAARGKYCVATI